ncbi:MAG: hypothetical protein H6709_08860 [Kofleriaceae bacterium]|nr:hypothetical protein [Kofleriaceae bacterium]
MIGGAWRARLRGDASPDGDDHAVLAWLAWSPGAWPHDVHAALAVEVPVDGAAPTALAALRYHRDGGALAGWSAAIAARTAADGDTAGLTIGWRGDASGAGADELRVDAEAWAATDDGPALRIALGVSW